MPVAALAECVAAITVKYAGFVDMRDNVLRITQSAGLVARLVARDLDAFAMLEDRPRRAL